MITLDLNLPADLALIPKVQASVRAAVTQTGSLSAERLQDLELAVAEILVPAIQDHLAEGVETPLNLTVELAKESVTFSVPNAIHAVAPATFVNS